MVPTFIMIAPAFMGPDICECLFRYRKCLARGSHLYSVSFPRQPESFIGQIRRDSKRYPADPNWHDCAFNRDMPSTQEANGMKKSYQKEEHCRV